MVGVSLRVRGEELCVDVRGYAWQPIAHLDAVDATLEVVAQHSRGPSRSVLAILHGRLERAGDGRFGTPLILDDVRELVEYGWDEAEQDRSPIRITDAQFCLTTSRLQQTQAPQWAGAARHVVNARFGLESDSGMQDWPLEVSDPSRVAEFCAYYDELTDPLVRFDVMQLALFSRDSQLRRGAGDTMAAWFERTLHRDFALHGHTVAYWAALDRPSDDPELQLADPEFVFAISARMRRAWDASIIAIDVEWTP